MEPLTIPGAEHGIPQEDAIRFASSEPLHSPAVSAEAPFQRWASPSAPPQFTRIREAAEHHSRPTLVDEQLWLRGMLRRLKTALAASQQGFAASSLQRIPVCGKLVAEQVVTPLIGDFACDHQENCTGATSRLTRSYEIETVGRPQS